MGVNRISHFHKEAELICGQDGDSGGVARAKLAPVSYGHGQLGIPYLCRGFTTQLASSFQKQEDTPHARVVGGKATAVGVYRRLLGIVKVEPPVADKGAAFALAAEAQVLDKAHHGDAERVIGHQNIDLRWRHSRLGESGGSRLGSGADRDITAILPVFGGLTGTDDPHRLLPGIAGDVCRGDHYRASSVGDHAALQQVQRVGNRARVHDIFRGDLVDANEFQVGHGLHCFRVAHGMAPGCHRDGGKLLFRGAVLEFVTRLDHGIVPDEREPPGVLHVAEEIGHIPAGCTGRADGSTIAMGRRAVGEQGHLAFTVGDHPVGVVGLELEGRTTHRGSVDDTGLEAKVFGNAKSPNPLVAAGVVLVPPKSQVATFLEEILQGDADIEEGRLIIETDEGRKFALTGLITLNGFFISAQSISRIE